MTTRFWIKEDADQSLLAFEIIICPVSEKSYIDTGLDFLDPAVADPSDLLAEMIDEVTVENYRIDSGFRTDGIYNHGGAMLRAETHEQVYGMPPEKPVYMERMIWQEISILAMSVAALRAIYSQFRQGLLKPKEDWEANAKIVVPTKPVEIKDFEIELPTTTKPKGKYGFDF